MDKQPRNGGGRNFSIGITSIAVIFTVVCLTIFAVLSVSTALQERKLSERYADAVSVYWLADAKCVSLANEFGALWERQAPMEDYEALAAEHNAQAEGAGDAVYVYFHEPIDEQNSLVVTLRIGERFEVLQWRQLFTGDWEADSSLDLWQGFDALPEVS